MPTMPRIFVDSLPATNTDHAIIILSHAHLDHYLQLRAWTGAIYCDNITKSLFDDDPRLVAISPGYIPVLDMFAFRTCHCEGSLGVIYRTNPSMKTQYTCNLGDGRLSKTLLRYLRKIIHKHDFKITRVLAEAHLRPTNPAVRYPSIAKSRKWLSQAIKAYPTRPVYVAHVGMLDLIPTDRPWKIIDPDNSKMVSRYINLYHPPTLSPNAIQLLVHRPSKSSPGVIIPSLRYWRNRTIFEPEIDDEGNIRIFYSGHADMYELQRAFDVLCSRQGY